MLYQWQFRPYRRHFKQALQTNHGAWAVRDGIILRLTDEAGNVGWGEIAPIPWFGSETIEQALEFCQQLPSELSNDRILSIPDRLPCCQFAFESAWEAIASQFSRPTEWLKQQNTGNQDSSLNTPHSRSLTYSALLPAGEAALHTWRPLWEQGFRTFKWKIGVEAIAIELEILHILTRNLPTTAKLRLDANAGLSTDDAAAWLQQCDTITANPDVPVTIEYIEQPLAIAQFQAMQDLSQHYRTSIALDESVARLDQLKACYDNGWRGIFVIKPAIVGSPFRLRQFCQTCAIDAVFSSALETAIGRQAGLRLAETLGNPDRAMGYGTTHWFDDAATTDFEQLWQTF
ncbi:o-succinylbenzoate synthase [Stenomitos frigidus]|uniref:o-succinylbenzoate synthase n=1 Tax=Stenomitos frigidus ULC18 TaxID=2107698 RepID=A0A2T1DZN5_9CYAN|nr:o-succinylbenzoate synthase [Stenomitos frigidus]PSB25919.1 o-succinylbenzoate synthase [Stenomitos frigidus ULC18]